MDTKLLNQSDYYINRELSWLEFNHNVLQEAKTLSNPILERLRFLGIFSSNLDEFFMIRVAGLIDQFQMNVTIPDTRTLLSPEEQLEKISEKTHDLVGKQYATFERTILQAQQQAHFRIKKINELSREELERAEAIFDQIIFPTLSPLGIDAYRAFPNLSNKRINIFVNLEKKKEKKVAIVPVPALIDRLYALSDGKEISYVFSEQLIQHCISKLFLGYKIHSTFCFRVTRNADLEIHEDGADDLLTVIEDYLKQRKNGMAVRLEIESSSSSMAKLDDISFLKEELELLERDIYSIEGPLDLTFIFGLYAKAVKIYPNLAYKPFQPFLDNRLEKESIFNLIEEKDIFLHHPYDSFDPVISFIEEASKDPHTISIKQTLYRVSKNSPIIAALKTAAENGIQVTVLVEVKARFDEENNVNWARELEEAGCQVLYGMTHLKTHSKIALVVQKKGEQIKRYVHLGTGNYNDTTAKFYTDMGILTANEEIAQDATAFFNYLSGYSDIPDYKHFYVSPFEIRDSLIEHIDREIEEHKKHQNGRIIAKMNSLTDKLVIKKLFEASIAGIQIDLIIRGICCLRPGIPGISDNIRVRTIVGRFLEHSRVYYFHNNGENRLYLSSADMMTRNMVKRVEIEFPVLDKGIVQRIKSILDYQLEDNQKARILQEDGTYVLANLDESRAPFNSQVFLMEEAEKRQAAQIAQADPIKKGRPWYSKLFDKMLHR